MIVKAENEISGNFLHDEAIHCRITPASNQISGFTSITNEVICWKGNSSRKRVRHIAALKPLQSI